MLVRCDKHPSILAYTHKVTPLGYPNTAAICGRPGCFKPGRVLLKDHEWRRYEEGERIFVGPNNFTKIRVE